MGDSQITLLCSLAPFNATEPYKAPKVYPIDEGCFQRIFVECMAIFFHMMDHLIMNHVSTVRLLFILLDCIEDNRYVVNVRVVRGGKLAVSVQTHRRINIIPDRGVPDLAALDGFASNEATGKAGDKVVPCL